MSAGSEQLSDVLARAALSDAERRVLERLVAWLREELGDDLHAVWLYGSRARGEANPYETDVDLMSDVDLMIVADTSRHWAPSDVRLYEAIGRMGDAEGVSPTLFSPRAWDLERLRGRREIRSFFVQEVDRDKLILHGSALE